MTHCDKPLLRHACGAAGDFIRQYPIELVHESVKAVPAVRKQHGTKKTQKANFASFQSKQTSCVISTGDMKMEPVCGI